jgi:hypothetical protein
VNWSIDNLFPICLVPTCPKYNTRHALTHQQEVINQILLGNENYIYWQGGVGSAKTLCIAAVCAALAIMIPKSEGILLRLDYELNHATLWGYFLNSIEAAFEQGILKGSFKKCLAVKKAGKHTEVRLPNGSFYKAGQNKNLSQVMGPSYDVIAISDAMENDGSRGPTFGYLFHGEGTVGGLQSRLRGQRSSNYKLPNGSYKDMRRFLIESNPPPNINELHSIFGKEPGIGYLPNTTVSYRHIQSHSIQNDHNPPTYVAELTSQHNDPNDVKRILAGKSIPYYGGIKVIPSFYPELHVNTFTVDKDLPLFVSIDQGLQHPSVTFSQIKRCDYDKEHFITLSEITNLYDKTTHELAFYEQGPYLGVLQHLALFYPDHFDLIAYTQVRDSLLKYQDSSDQRVDLSILENHFSKIFFCIDKSANKVQPSSKDRESDRSILLFSYGINCKYRNNIGLNLSLIREREAFKEICNCNIPRLLIDRKCELLIDGLNGGYRYPKNKDGTHNDKPIEDHRYEDVCDSYRYALENFFFIYTGEIIEQRPTISRDNFNWEWMVKK